MVACSKQAKRSRKCVKNYYDLTLAAGHIGTDIYTGIKIIATFT